VNFSPSILGVTKSKIKKWAGHVALRGVYRVLLEKIWERDLLEDPSVDGMIILRWIFRKWDVRTWTGSILLRIRTVGGLF